MGLGQSGVLYLAAWRRSNARKSEAPDRISGLDPCGPDHFEIFRHFARHEGVHFPRGHRQRLDAEPRQGFLHQRLGEKFCARGMKLLDQFAGHQGPIISGKMVS